MNTIIYLHGFASSGDADKALLLKHYFEHDKVITPTLSAKPIEAIHQIDRLISEHGTGILVGSSLGGFYADAFSAMYDWPAVLINPLTDPQDMKQFIGSNKNFKTDQTFDWSEEDIQIFGKLNRHRLEHRTASEIILVAEDDHVLDPSKAIEAFQEDVQIVRTFSSGGHRFTNDDAFIEAVEDLLKETRLTESRLREHWLNLTTSTSKEIMWPEVSKLIELSYADLPGGFLGSGEELMADNTFWKLSRRDGKIVAGIIYKNQLGRKGVCAFTDGTKPGKMELFTIIKDDQHFGRAWIEVSGPLEKAYMRNYSPLPHAVVDVILSAIGKKVLHWHNDNIHYDRELGGHPHTKCMFGTAKLS